MKKGSFFISISTIFLAIFLLTGCSTREQKTTIIYPRKPADTEDRKAGAAMLFYEQAEKDMDVNDSVIVIPPAEKQETTTPPAE